jgi:hypothetical protein
MSDCKCIADSTGNANTCTVPGHLLKCGRTSATFHVREFPIHHDISAVIEVNKFDSRKTPIEFGLLQICLQSHVTDMFSSA